MKTARGKRRRYPPDERRALILKAARAYISEHGMFRATAREIAARCGISTGTLTHHFDSMDELLTEALRVGSEQYTNNWLRSLQTHTGALERLHFFIDENLADRPKALTMWRLWLEYWSRAVHRPSLSAAQSERYRALRGAIERVIADGVESGEFRSVDPKLVAREFIGLFDGVGLEAAVGDEEMTVDDARALLRTFLSARLLPTEKD